MSDTEIPKGHGGWHGGKGSVAKDSNNKKYADNWDKIFGNKDRKPTEEDIVADEYNSFVEGAEKDGPPIPHGLAAAWARKEKNKK